MTYHAHIESASSDCDGLYTRDYIMVCDDETDDWQFRDHVLTCVVSANPDHGGNLTITPPFEDGTNRFIWNEQTDEGYRHVEATFCYDDCDLGDSSFRDHTAEQMGY